MKVVIVTLLIVLSLAVFHVSAETRAKRAINPFLDSMGKRAVNPFLDSFGKRSDNSFPYKPFRAQNMQKRYFDSLAGQSLGKRSALSYDY